MSEFATAVRLYIDIWCWFTFAVMVMASAMYAVGRASEKPSTMRGVSFIVSGIMMVLWFVYRPAF